MSSISPFIKEKLAILSKSQQGANNQIELVVLVGENEAIVKTKIQQLGGKYESLGYGYGIITISYEKIDNVFAINEVLYIELPKTLYTSFIESNRESCITSVWDLYGLTGKGVLIGFLDSGIDYLHPAFIDENGNTRIEYIYDLAKGGAIWNKESINKAIKSNDPYSIVPERDEIGHGTHVAGIACAGGKIDKRYYGVAYESSIAMVKMTSEGKTNYAKSTQLMRGIKFLVDKSRELQIPLVINLSFSTNDGAHDGQSLLERYISTICLSERISFAVAAGNEGDTAHHVGGVLREQQTIGVNIAEDETNIVFQLYKGILDDIGIQIKSPSGSSTDIITLKEGFMQGIIDGNNYFLLNTGARPFNINGEIIISLVAQGEFLSSGTWNLVIYRISGNGQPYNIWLPVAEGLNVKTKFLKPDVYNTLGIPATAANVISVGSYNYRTQSISSFSGRGKLNCADCTQLAECSPNIVAPGENIESTIPDGSFDSLSGTSMATPSVSGSCALLMQWGIVQENDTLMYGNRLKNFLLRAAQRNRPSTIYPNPDWGYGSLCLKGALDLATSYKLSRAYRQETCGDLFLKENYISYLVEYDGDIEKDFANIPNACAFVLDENYAIVTVEDTLNIDIRTFKDVVYAEEPAIYTLCSLSPVEAANITKVQTNQYLSLTGSGVLVGVIDTGIDYLLKEFMYEDNTTKIVSIWDEENTKGNPPKDFNFGTEYTRVDINNAISAKNKGEDPYAIVDSKDLYGHGTAMASIIAARGNTIQSAAPDSELVVVKLKPAKKNVLNLRGIKEARCAAYDTTDVILGIKYLYLKAKEMNKPMVIYIPLGTNMGSHDGGSIIEKYIDGISRVRGIAVVTGTGNEGESDTHTEGVLLKADDRRTFELKVDELQTSLDFEIWCYKPDKISLGMVSPSGESIAKIPAKLNQIENINFVFENTIVTIRYFMPEEGTGDELIRIKMRNLKGGVWRFILIGDFIVDGKYNAWLPQRSLLYDSTRFLSPTPNTTLTIPSTSRAAIATASYNQDNNSILTQSGRGYTRDGRIEPDITTGGYNTTCLKPGGGTTTMTGSSVATAVLAGAVALLFQWGVVEGRDPTLYSTKIKTYLIRGAQRRAGETYPNNIWGYGTLDLFATFENVRSRCINNSKMYINIPKEIRMDMIE